MSSRCISAASAGPWVKRPARLGAMCTTAEPLIQYTHTHQYTHTQSIQYISIPIHTYTVYTHQHTHTHSIQYTHKHQHTNAHSVQCTHTQQYTHTHVHSIPTHTQSVCHDETVCHGRRNCLPRRRSCLPCLPATTKLAICDPMTRAICSGLRCSLPAMPWRHSAHGAQIAAHSPCVLDPSVLHARPRSLGASRAA